MRAVMGRISPLCSSAWHLLHSCLGCSTGSDSPSETAAMHRRLIHILSRALCLPRGVQYRDANVEGRREEFVGGG